MGKKFREEISATADQALLAARTTIATKRDLRYGGFDTSLVRFDPHAPTRSPPGERRAQHRCGGAPLSHRADAIQRDPPRRGRGNQRARPGCCGSGPRLDIE